MLEELNEELSQLKYELKIIKILDRQSGHQLIKEVTSIEGEIIALKRRIEIFLILN